MSQNHESTEVRDLLGEVVPRKRITITDSGKKIDLTEEMIRLRNGIAQGLGYTLGPCSFHRVPRKDGQPHGPPRDCWERGTWVEDGIEIGNEHVVPMFRGEQLRMPGCDVYNWPDQVRKAAKTIDRDGRPPRKAAP